MKVLSCKVSDTIYNKFKKQNSNVSEAIRELIVNSLKTHSIPVVNQRTPVDSIESLHAFCDTLEPFKFDNAKRRSESEQPHPEGSHKIAENGELIEGEIVEPAIIEDTLQSEQKKWRFFK